MGDNEQQTDFAPPPSAVEATPIMTPSSTPESPPEPGNSKDTVVDVSAPHTVKPGGEPPVVVPLMRRPSSTEPQTMRLDGELEWGTNFCLRSAEPGMEPADQHSAADMSGPPAGLASLALGQYSQLPFEQTEPLAHPYPYPTPRSYPGHLEAYLLRPTCDDGLGSSKFVMFSYKMELFPLQEQEIKVHLNKLKPAYSVIDSLDSLPPQQLRLVLDRVKTRQGNIIFVQQTRDVELVTEMGTFKGGSVIFIISTPLSKDAGNATGQQSVLVGKKSAKPVEHVKPTTAQELLQNTLQGFSSLAKKPAESGPSTLFGRPSQPVVDAGALGGGTLFSNASSGPAWKPLLTSTTSVDQATQTGGLLGVQEPHAVSLIGDYQPQIGGGHAGGSQPDKPNTSLGSRLFGQAPSSQPGGLFGQAPSSQSGGVFGQSIIPQQPGHYGQSTLPQQEDLFDELTFNQLYGPFGGIKSHLYKPDVNIPLGSQFYKPPTLSHPGAPGALFGGSQPHKPDNTTSGDGLFGQALPPEHAAFFKRFPPPQSPRHSGGQPHKRNNDTSGPSNFARAALAQLQAARLSGEYQPPSNNIPTKSHARRRQEAYNKRHNALVAVPSDNTSKINTKQGEGRKTTTTAPAPTIAHDKTTSISISVRPYPTLCIECSTSLSFHTKREKKIGKCDVCASSLRLFPTDCHFCSEQIEERRKATMEDWETPNSGAAEADAVAGVGDETEADDEVPTGLDSAGEGKVDKGKGKAKLNPTVEDVPDEEEDV